MYILPSLLVTLPLVFLVIFLANWFAQWFKPLNVVLFGIQLSIIGVFMLVLWFVLNDNSTEHQYNILIYFASVVSLVGLLLSCSFAFRRH